MLWGSSVAGTLVISCHLPVRVSGYRGDGTISKVDFLLNPGFQVEFEQFSLSAVHRATYRLDGLPKHHDTYRVGIVLAVLPQELGRRPKALDDVQLSTLQVRLIDGTGRSIFECRSSLGEMSWTWTREQFFGTLHSPESPACVNSTFMLGKLDSPPYLPTLLEVTYEPASGAVDLMAKVRVIAGGTE